MIRRARLSFKPNVRPSGRVLGQGSASNGRDEGVVPPGEPIPDPGKEAKTAGTGDSTAPVTGDAAEPQPPEENKAELSIESAATVSNETPTSKTTSTPLQRRKRISTLPNLAKPRVSNSAPAALPPPKPTQVDIPSTLPIDPASCKNEGSPPEKGKVLSPQKSQLPLFPPQGHHVTLPEKRTPVPPVPQFSPYKKSVTLAKPVECPLKDEPSPLKERPSQKSCYNELFEVIKTTTQKKRITSDLEKERLRRAQKLRDLLKAELRKERKVWKAKHPVISPTEEPERSKMMMRDFIHFIPMTNPMSSSLEESKSSEKFTPVESQVTVMGGKNSAEEDDLDDDKEEDDSQLLAPRVKVAEDGSIILDEESLTVEVSRSKGAPIVEGNDPIFERGSTTTYSSFRRNNYSKPWSEQETDMFFLAISMVGTDFSMIGQLFPHRERIEIKNKFKKEERVNGWRIDKAFREKKDFDFEFFSHLLEKALEAGKKKKTRSKQPRKTNAKSRKKTKDKTAAEQSLCDQESVISEEEGADARTAEKENKRSLDADECSGVDDPVPVKKKRAKRKKDTTKEPEEENHESQDDDLTPKPKKKSSRSKTAPRDTDNRSELQSVDSDGSLKETLAEKKTRVQKNKPNYKESELEDDENDADFDITEDLEVDDAHISGKAGEDDLSSQSEETSLVLFTEESDYQSGLEDLSSIHHSLNEVNEAVLQVSDVSLVAPNFMLGETEPVNITREETSPPAYDESDGLDKALDAEGGQLGDQDLEPKHKRKMPQVRPAPNLSRAAVKKKVSTEEQSDRKHQADPSEDIDVGKPDKKIVQKEGFSADQQVQDGAAMAENSPTPHNGQKEPTIKPSSLGRGRLQRPKPNLLARSSTKIEKLDVIDAKDVSMEGNERCADTQKEREDTGNPNKGADVSSIDNHRQDSSSTVQVSSLIEKDVGSESDLSQTEESNTVQDHDKGDTSKEKPSLPVRGRLSPKPNLTRAPVKSKYSDTQQESLHSQVSGQVSHVAVKPPLHTPAKDQENEVKNRLESSSGSQDECGKSSIKPAPLARGCFQRPKPNLVKAAPRKESFDDQEESVAHTEEDSGGDSQRDRSSGTQENETLNTGSGASQDSFKSEKNVHPSSSLQLTQDCTVNQDHLTESPSISKTQDIKSPGKPATLTRGRLQKPKPNLGRASGQKGCERKDSKSFQVDSDTIEKRSSNDNSASCAGNPTELVKEAPSIELHTQDSACLGKPDSVQPLKVDHKNLAEEPITPLKPAVLPKGRFQRPKPNLVRAAAKRDGLTSPDESKNIAEGEAGVERAPESTDNTSNMPVNEAGTAPLLAETNEGRSVPEKDYVTLEKPNKGASHGTSVDSTPAITGKEQTASDDDRKTLKPVLTRGRFQRPKPNLNKSATRSVVAAPLVSTVEEEEKGTGTASTHKTGPNISLDGKVLSDGDAEIKSTVKDACDKTDAKALAQPAEGTSDAEQSEAASLKPVRTRFPKPSPNLGRAAVRKETSTTQPKTLVPEKGEETSKVNDEHPEDLPGTSIAGPGSKEAGQTIEEKLAAIKPAQLRRGRLIRPVPNLVKPSSKTLSPLQSKTNEDLNGAPEDKDSNHEVATSSQTNKRKASSCNVDVSPKRICPSDAPQKPPCLSDSEVDQASLTNDAQSCSQSSSMQDAATPQRSRFGRNLRKLSTPPSMSPKSEKSSDRPEKEKAARNVKSSTTKVSKPVSSKSKGKTTLVKIRATRQEEDEDEDADADLGFDEENYDLAPDMQNQAPVFIPFSLRSPRPVTAEIEETVEELEIPVDVVDLPNGTNQDLENTPFQHVVDPQAETDKKEQCDGSAEAAMTLISIGSSVYKPNTGELSSTRIQNNQEQLSSVKEFSPPSKNLLSSPRHVCAMESSLNVEPRMVADPYCAPTDCGSAENLPNPVNDSIVFPVEQMNYPVMQGDALQGDFSSQDVSVSDCLLREHDTGEEATFILTLVEIPINDDYAYSCDSSTAESLPAPVLISSGSSQALTQNLNPSVETVTYEPHVVGQDDKDLILGQTSRKRSVACIDEADHTPLQKKPPVSEQEVDPDIKATADESDSDGKVAPEISPEEPAGVSHIGASAVRERPPYCPIAKNCDTVPVEMPGMSVTNALNRNLPLVYANSVTTSKTALKRPGKKPLGFLSLICKDKQTKKLNEENRKKKNLPKPKCRKVSSTAQGQQKESLDLNLENANDSEVPSSSSMFSPAELLSTATEEADPSISQISDNQGTEGQTPSKSHDLITEEEAASVSEYFFSDIFMEVDD